MSDYSINATIGADDSDFQKTFGDMNKSLEEWGLNFGKMYEKGAEFFKGFGIDIDKFSEKLGTTGPSLMLMTGAIVGMVEIGKQLAVVIADCTKEFAEDETAALKFNAAIASSDTMTEGAAERLNALAESLSLTTGMANSAAQSQIAMLVATGRTEPEINKMITAAKGLAVATGTTLDAALNQINQTFSGSIGRMGKMTPALAELSKEELANGGAIDILIDKYGELSGVLDNSSDVSMKNYANSWGELKSAFGDVFEDYIKPIRDAITDIVMGFVEWSNENGNLKKTMEVLVIVLASVIGGMIAFAAVSAIGPIIAGVSGAIGGLSLAFKALTLAMAANPIGLIAALITAIVIPAIILLVKNWDMVVVMFQETMANLKYLFASMGSYIVEGFVVGFNSAKIAALTFAQVIYVNILNGIAKMLEVMSKLPVVGKLFDEASKAVSGFAGKLDDVIEGAKDESKATIQAAKDTQKATGEKLRTELAAFKVESDNRKKAIAEKKNADAEAIKSDDTVVAAVADNAEEKKEIEVETTNVVKKESDERTVIIQDGLSSVSTGNLDSANVIKSAWAGLTTDLGNAWDDFIEDATNKAESWKDTFKEIGSAITGGVGTALETVGKILVTGAGWEVFGNIALGVMAQVLEAIGGQLAAMAVMKAVAGDWAGALLAAAGSAAAFVAAGAAKAMVNTGKAAQDAAVQVNNLAVALDTGASNANDVVKKMTLLPDVLNRQAEAERKLAIWQRAKIINEGLLADALYKKNAAIAAGDTGAELQYYFDTYQTLRNQSEALRQIPALQIDIANAIAYKANVIANADKEISESTKSVNAEMAANINLFKDSAQAGIAYKSTLLSISNAALSFSQSLQNVGTEISSSLIDNLSKGLTESDFMQTMKDYITNMVVQAAVYTEALKSKMATIGAAIAAGIASGFSGTSLQGIKDQLSSLYTQASEASKTATDIVGSVFTGYASGTDYATAGYHMVGEQGPERMYIPQGARITNAQNTRNDNRSSVTFAPVFNSPKAMNQNEQMRALRQSQREMAFKGVV